MATTWHKLENFACPAEDCESTKKYNWYCARDGNPMYVSQTGYLSCEDGSHYSQISTWSFDCGNHGQTGNYWKVDGQKFSYSVSMAAQLLEQSGSAWLSQLVMELGQQYGF